MFVRWWVTMLPRSLISHYYGQWPPLIMVYMISVYFRKKLPNCLLRPGTCQAWDQYIGILPNWLKPLQYLSPYRPMCKLHVLNLDFKKVMSIYEVALWVDGPNIEPTLSPYPPRTCPTVLAGNPPRSPHPRLLAHTRPAPRAAGLTGRGGAERPGQTSKLYYLHKLMSF